MKAFCKLGSPQEVRFSLLNLGKFQKTEKSTSESCKIFWNLTNDQEFGYFEFLKLKYRKGWWGANNSVILQDWFRKIN